MKEIEIIINSTQTLMIHLDDNRCLQVLNEARSVYDVGGPRSLEKDTSHYPGNEEHVHGYDRGKEIFVMTKRGKASHGFSGTRIPSAYQKVIKQCLPDFVIPPKGILEDTLYGKIQRLLDEAKDE